MINHQLPVCDLLSLWEQERLLTPLDRHFALQMAAIHQEDSALFLLICALISRQLSAQHTCLPLANIDFANPMAERQPQIQINASQEEFLSEIMHFSAVGQADNDTPIILAGNRLYLKRYFDFEQRVASRLISMSNKNYPADEHVKQALDKLFPTSDNSSSNGQNIDWQKVATATAYCRKLSIITGGPGTGKTTTVTKLLFLLTLNENMIIRLVAPTGKAAARLSESIKLSKQRLKEELKNVVDGLDLAALDRIPEEASTLHRLLGVLPDSHKFRYHKNNPLHLDLLLVDEASMVDLPMMDRLLDALPEHARLVLLGDQDQLASVEAGAVLADICTGLRNKDDWKMHYSQDFAKMLSQLTGFDLLPFATEKSDIGNNLCMLLYSHRFKDDAGIGVLAKAVNQCHAAAITRAWNYGYQELDWIEHGNQKQGLKRILTLACEEYRNYLEILHRTDFATQDIIERYNDFRILCATRSGEFGVDGLNQQVTQALKQAGLIRPELEFYPGRPVIIQNNDYNLGLFNGDIGIILPCKDAGRLMAHFIQADGSVLKVLPARLPGHETCFAMTVHKSQGSEFTSVALVLPPYPSPSQWQLLTKELIYTAITRAKQHFTCLGNKRVFEGACLQRTARASGLAEKLWPSKLLAKRGNP